MNDVRGLKLCNLRIYHFGPFLAHHPLIFTSDEIFDLIDNEMEYSGSGDFISADSMSSESESDLFFTVPLVSETTTTKTIVTKANIQAGIDTISNIRFDKLASISQYLIQLSLASLSSVFTWFI